MNFDQLITAVVDKKDPNKESKKLQLHYWWSTFSGLLGWDTQERLQFFSDILSDSECWENSQTIHRIKLNRRMVARKMVHSHSRYGKTNPLSLRKRYQVACKCCLEEDIAALFEKIKQNYSIKAEDTTALKKLVKKLSKDICCEELMTYWSHAVSGYASELKLEGKHQYEYGLEHALGICRHVEAVEFFWNKIKYLPIDELSFKKKQEIFIQATLRATSNSVQNSSDIFEFCISHISSNMYPDILKRDFADNGNYGSFHVLLELCRFDLIKKLLDCLEPEDITENIYGHLLKSLNWDRYPTHYTNEAVELFIFVWMKEGFERHRDFALRAGKIDFSCPGNILVPLAEQNYMDIIWEVFEKTSLQKMKTIMKSEQIRYVSFLLQNRGDTDSWDKLQSYRYSTQKLINLRNTPTKTVTEIPSKK